MTLIEAAVQLHPERHDYRSEPEYSLSIETIIAVIALVVQLCDLDIPNIITRSREMPFRDRARIRLLCMRHGLRIPDLAQRVQHFCNRQSDDDLTNLIEELRSI